MPSKVGQAWYVAQTSFLLKPANHPKHNTTQQEVVVVGPRVLFLPLPHNQPSPLALELSRSPSLRILRTLLPPAWNPSLLIVSENPNLVRIVLTTPQVSRSPGSVVATDEAVSTSALLARRRRDEHPWLVEAQKHPRLMRLIGAEEGTDDIAYPSIPWS